jgi:hypothetical protein
MPLFADCTILFLGPSNGLYCSEDGSHRVVKISLLQPGSGVSVVAGMGCPGSGVYELNSPRGIFVSASQDLYVADCYNHRVQRYRSGELNWTTVAGNGVSGNISLYDPTSVILDADGYLFISDYHSHRVVGSGLFGFRCIVGCSGLSGSTSAYLYYPWSISFDSVSNLYVLDYYNNRVQRFQLISNTLSGIRHHLHLVPCD